MSFLLRAYSKASKRFPYSVAFATCFVKGSASDSVAQLVIEQRAFPFGKRDDKLNSGAERFSLRRNFAFALFSGIYLGGFQHFLYNVAFTRLFGAGQSLKVALQKVAADLLVTTPFICHPVYYSSEYGILKGDPAEGLRTYFIGKPGGSPEFVPVMSRYAMIWPAFHLFNFTITPPELRIAGIACVSFVWLTILSNVSHKELHVEEGTEEIEGVREK